MIAAALVACVAYAGWLIWRPMEVMEPPTPEMRQADGSLMLERRPDPTARPRQQTPRGTTVERIARVTVQPDAAPESGPPCPPVTVDMTLIRDAGGGRRVLASSPDGQVVGGLDVPVEPMVIQPTQKLWASGVSWEPMQQTLGIWVERDLQMPLVDMAARVGVDINQVRVDTSARPEFEARIRVGLAW
jgi:hypothetical protein